MGIDALFSGFESVKMKEQYGGLCTEFESAINLNIF